MTTNIAEFFNVWLKEESHQTIYTLLLIHMDELVAMLYTHMSGTEKWKSLVILKIEDKLMLNIMRFGPINVMPYYGKGWGRGRLRCLLGSFIWLWICNNVQVLVSHGKCPDFHVHMYMLSSAQWDTMCMSISTHVFMSPFNSWFTQVSFNHYQFKTYPKFVRMGVCKMEQTTYFLLSNPHMWDVLQEDLDKGALSHNLAIRELFIALNAMV